MCPPNRRADQDCLNPKCSLSDSYIPPIDRKPEPKPEPKKD